MRRFSVVLFATAALIAANSSSAGAAVKVGETFTPDGSWGGSGVLIQVGAPGDINVVPTAGVLTSWSFEATAIEPTPPLKMKVMRHAGGDGFTTVADSALQTPMQGVLNTWPTRISVSAGDLLALFFTGDTFGYGNPPDAQYVTREISGAPGTPGIDPPPGTTTLFDSPTTSQRADVSAMLEPDADRDGFGDETQDQCIGTPGPQNGCPAPGASLDANCPGPPEATVFIADSGMERWAQTFTAQSTGVVTSAQAAVTKGPGADWLLQVAALDGTGAPTYNILASATIPDSAIPGGGTVVDTFVSAGFASPPPVKAGQQYALILARPSFGVELRVREGDDCAGQLFASEDLGPFSLFAPDEDMVFAVFVEPTNSFSVGAVKRNKKKGTATINLTLPNPGELTGSGKGVKASSAGGAVISKPVGAGQAQLLIKAKGKKKKKLNQKGKAKLSVAISFTPTGGQPNTQLVKVKLKKKL